mgnify:CR=1 FL=1
MTPPPLRRIHDDATLQSPGNRSSLRFWGGHSTADIIESQRPGNEKCFKVKSHGRVFDGNTRVQVLEERN